MILVDWVLPILIGIVAAIAIISILYNNPKVKAYFKNIDGFTQDTISNLGEFEVPIWKPIPYNHNETIEIPENEYIEHKKICNLNSKNLDNTNVKITHIGSPLYTGIDKGYPIYNYYPKIILN